MEELHSSAGKGTGKKVVTLAADVEVPSEDLLGFYKAQVDRFQQEREEYLQRLAAIEVSQKELHQLRWEVKVRDEEIEELQKALSDSKIYLVEEREQLLKLQAENERLKIQEMEDRQRIQHLLALSQPVSQEVTFFRDCRPESITRFPVNGNKTKQKKPTRSERHEEGPKPGRQGYPLGAEGKSAEGKGEESGSSPHHSSGVSPRSSSSHGSDQARRLLRTVYLPSERTDALILSVESLQRQVEDLKELLDTKTQAWRDERRARDEAFRRKTDSDAVRLSMLEKELQDTRQKLRDTTKEYLQYRHDSQKDLRGAHDKLQGAVEANQRALEELRQTREYSTRQVEEVKKAAIEEAEQFQKYTKQQSSTRENDIRLLKEQYSQVQKLYDARVKELEDQVSTWKKRYRNLERRRNLEVEGFTRDIDMLRKSIRQLEAQWVLLEAETETRQMKKANEAADDIAGRLSRARSKEPPSKYTKPSEPVLQLYNSVNGDAYPDSREEEPDQENVYEEDGPMGQGGNSFRPTRAAWAPPLTPLIQTAWQQSTPSFGEQLSNRLASTSLGTQAKVWGQRRLGQPGPSIAGATKKKRSSVASGHSSGPRDQGRLRTKPPAVTSVASSKRAVAKKKPAKKKTTKKKSKKTVSMTELERELPLTTEVSELERVKRPAPRTQRFEDDKPVEDVSWNEVLKDVREIAERWVTGEQSSSSPSNSEQRTLSLSSGAGSETKHADAPSLSGISGVSSLGGSNKVWGQGEDEPEGARHHEGEEYVGDEEGQELKRNLDDLLGCLSELEKRASDWGASSGAARKAEAEEGGEGK